MFRSSFSARRKIFAHWEEQRQAAADVGVDVGFAMLDFRSVDLPAVDKIAQHGLDIVRIGENAQRRRGIGRLLWRRAHLARLDEADACRAIGSEEEAEKHFAVAVAPQDDFLLPPLPIIGPHKIVEHRLHGGDPLRGRLLAFLCRGKVGVARADDEADPIFVAVDGKLIAERQHAALVADFAELHFSGRAATDEPAAKPVESHRQPGRSHRHRTAHRADRRTCPTILHKPLAGDFRAGPAATGWRNHLFDSYRTRFSLQFY